MSGLSVLWCSASALISLKISLHLSSEHNAQSHQRILRRFSCQICDLLLPISQHRISFSNLNFKTNPPPKKCHRQVSLSGVQGERSAPRSYAFLTFQAVYCEVLRNFFFQARSFLLSGLMLESFERINKRAQPFPPFISGWKQIKNSIMSM